MKRSVFCFTLLYFYCFLSGYGQQDSITILDEVFLTDTKLKKFSIGQTLIKISDSVTKHHRPLLTSLLQFTTPIYFKENGFGMVSSPSFRGTTASQTAVLWNGININSHFNGQTDFNTISSAVYDEIMVRGGGGSVIYGTGAIGGTIHLNTGLSFKKEIEHDILLRYGSFNTIDARYTLEGSRGDWSFTVSGARNSSDNDYEYPNGNKNMNGEFYSNAVDLGVGYRLNSKNNFRFFSSFFDGERHFSLIRPSETRTKYEDLNNRNLLEWKIEAGKLKSVSKVAFLSERYKYFANISSQNHTFGEAETFIARNDLEYFINKDLEINSVLTNTYTNGEGSNLGENSRNIFSAAFLLKHKFSAKAAYELGLRKELTENYKSPLLFSAGAKYSFSDFYTLKINASRNFRIPTYNDLYWTSVGNLDLNPETSLQGEIGNGFIWRNLKLDLTAYYINIDDMIRWLPGSDGVWRPQNVDKVHSYGLEVLVNWKKKINQGTLGLSGTYAYTVSENENTGNQLIYVPYHKANAALTYGYERWQVDYQVLINGEVFTRSDNNSTYNLNAYSISNLGVSYAFGNMKNYQMGVKAENLFNTSYQNVEDRWMPGVNFNIYLNLNF